MTSSNFYSMVRTQTREGNKPTDRVQQSDANYIEVFPAFGEKLNCIYGRVPLVGGAPFFIYSNECKKYCQYHGKAFVMVSMLKTRRGGFYCLPFFLPFKQLLKMQRLFRIMRAIIAAVLLVVTAFCLSLVMLVWRLINAKGYKRTGSPFFNEILNGGFKDVL